MSSKWGEKNGLPGYDKFRTGLTYQTVWEMMRDESEDPSDWRHKRRGTVLGMWHQLKLELYHQAMDQLDDQGEAMEPGTGRGKAT